MPDLIILKKLINNTLPIYYTNYHLILFALVSNYQ